MASFGVPDRSHAVSLSIGGRPRRQAFTSAQRQNIAICRNWTCAACGRRDLHTTTGWDVDHIIEIADGGAAGVENLQLLCCTCHADKTRLNMMVRAGIRRCGSAQTSARTSDRNERDDDEVRSAPKSVLVEIAAIHGEMDGENERHLRRMRKLNERLGVLCGAIPTSSAPICLKLAYAELFAHADPKIYQLVYENIWIIDEDGRRKLFHMFLEKRKSAADAESADWKSWGLSRAEVDVGLKLQHMRAIKTLLAPSLPEREQLTEAVVISRERMEATAAYLAANETQLFEIFKVRDQTKVTTPRDVAWSVTFMNKLLSEWSFVHIKRKQCKMQKNNVVTKYNKYHIWSTCSVVSLADMRKLIN